MTPARIAAASVLGLRIAYGAGLVAAPARLARSWIGPVSDQPGGRVALRALGAREIFLHVGALQAVLRGAPALPWLAASVGGDLSDIASTARERERLPDRAAPATGLVAGASALATVGVAAALERSG
jgi:hypothetical protein